MNATKQAGEAISSQAEKAATLATDIASAGFDALKSQGEAVGGSVTSVIQKGARSTSEFGRETPERPFKAILRDTLERQPLLLGAIGVALGAGIAAAFPATALEKEVMGEAGASMKEKMQEVAAGDLRSEPRTWLQKSRTRRKRRA